MVLTQQKKIRLAMLKAGVTNLQIAEMEKVTKTYVTYVITGRRVGHRIRKAIAKACKVPVKDLWPEEPSDEPDLPAAA